MTGAFRVEAEQLKAHAQSIDAIKQRFAKVKAASSHIAGDDQAYGVLCGWISAVLEGRHTEIDGVIATVEHNLELVAKELRASAETYAATDQDTVERLKSAGGER
ncbi:type VII secretion target [Lentzea sp.]|uniref:type VII secretion target n=1 Tax=Lentzea sp. TaxID=56099 RepID=UPI002ED3662F